MDRRVRRVSKNLLGGYYRLEIASAIHEAADGKVFTYRLAGALGIKDNQVNTDLQHFEAEGLVRKAVRQPQSRAQPYERIDSEFWPGCAGLLKQLEARSEDDWLALGKPPIPDEGDPT